MENGVLVIVDKILPLEDSSWFRGGPSGSNPNKYCKPGEVGVVLYSPEQFGGEVVAVKHGDGFVRRYHLDEVQRLTLTQARKWAENTPAHILLEKMMQEMIRGRGARVLTPRQFKEEFGYNPSLKSCNCHRVVLDTSGSGSCTANLFEEEI